MSSMQKLVIKGELVKGVRKEEVAGAHEMADASGSGSSYGSSTPNMKSWGHPAHRMHRFIALFFMCFVSFGSYFCYDNPAALADNFTDDLHISTTEFTVLYSIYSWPNVILCFIGGFLVDKYFGVRLGTIIFMGILCTGAILFALGGYINAYWLMVAGRFIFGIGGESLAVAVNNYAVLWFKGKELNMVFGFQLSFARVGSTVNFIVMEPIYKWVAKYYSGPQRIGVVLFIASLTCIISLICGLILGWMDKRAERILNRQANLSEGDAVKLSDVRYFKMTFWMVSAICVAYYVAIFPFIALGKLFFERKFEFAPQSANYLTSLVYAIAAVLSPAFGILIDKTGRNMYWVILSICMTIGAHVMLSFTFWDPYGAMCLMGIAYALLASGLWPLVALIVPEHQLGTAYGICQSVQNLGLAVTSILVGLIVDRFGFLMLEMFFLGWLFVALIVAVVIYIVDSAGKGNLNLSPSEHEALAKVSDETKNLLDDEESTETDTAREDPAQVQSNRIRSRYVAQILLSTDIPDRQ